MTAEGVLREQVAIVTGAGRGIGRAIALELGANGASVVLAGRTIPPLDAVSSEIRDGGGRSLVCGTDISSEDSVRNIFSCCLAEFGRLDILVNNAGLGIYGPLESTTTEDWDRIMAVNARGTFMMCREAIPHLRKGERSFIVNIASVVARKGYENQSAYTASKHAMLGMTKSLGRELQGDGIRVHAICPGAVDTEMARAARPDIDPSTYISVQDVADSVLFLVTRSGPGVIDGIDIRRETSTAWG